ncbi:DegT/DnrJ/EryC1/StrS family aminotransferase [Endozoicomonas euniceicola]|uniref:DegT/DnrJ/EryC1/StrS aminotransferase family protein n=1 Tax=Endozoicomonas euniceicola TaxID=1234143 RepID=A0ABY6GUG2_9GAMM|nr:DegT/DnrJ/EryC1/StrS aminotransferase family protein [Endozoicomonas euniceicola]UYM16416.1 DegT/DnrJ/EryC1/StrS aminotransferase family protein [Endozoicomonas euniceicola]
MLNTPFSPWPSFTEEEADAVSKTLLSNKVNYWTGMVCREFEREFSLFTGSNYSIALANGSVALELALKALDINVGDEVIVTSRTFIASASSIMTAGATPIFADVDRDSQNVTAETIRKVLTVKTKAIICVHLAGWPCEMDDIMALAAEHNLFVIEDCAQAHGAHYKGRSVGSIGHIGSWSFCQDKIMTTGGEGGMVTTNDESLWKKMWAYKDHGKSWDAVYNQQHPPGFRWLHESFGTNWRLTEMQSSIGRIQLKRMPGWTKQRQVNAMTISEACQSIPALRVPKVPGHIKHAHYKHYVFVRPEQLKEGWSRNRILDEMVKEGVPCFQGSCSEVYLEKAFENTGFRPEKRLPVAKELGETSLMFLVHPTLLQHEIEKTCDTLQAVMLRVSR